MGLVMYLCGSLLSCKHVSFLSYTHSDHDMSSTVYEHQLQRHLKKCNATKKGIPVSQTVIVSHIPMYYQHLGLSWDVTSCPRMSQVVLGCHELSQDVVDCSSMSQIVPERHRLSQYVPGCHRLSWDIMDCPKMSQTVLKSHRLSWDVLNKMTFCMSMNYMQVLYSLYYL